MIRASITISLIGVLMLPFMTAYFAGHWSKRQIRNQVKRQIIAGLEKDDLVHWVFTIDELDQVEWEHESEFKFQGQMYDVVFRENEGDCVQLWCWWDHQETHLEKKLEQDLNRALGSDPNHQTNQLAAIGFYFHMLIQNLEVDLDTPDPEEHLMNPAVPWYASHHWQTPESPPPDEYTAWILF